MNKAFALCALLSLAGCDRGSYTPEPRPSGEESSGLSLRELLPPGAVPVGVAVTPSQKRYVLDQRSGLYEVTDEQASLVFNTSGLSGVELTDVVALDEDRFALTAENDGFLLDLRTGELTSYFCYLPAPPQEPSPEPTGSGGGPGVVVAAPISVSQTLQLEGVAVSQRTESVAFNPENRQLFAQPRTTRLDTNGIAGSELFVFGEQGGEPTQVVSMTDASFLAGGMAVLPGDRLLLGAGSAIFATNPGGQLNRQRDLDQAVVITGMARSLRGLLVLDGAGQRLLEVEGL